MKVELPTQPVAWESKGIRRNSLKPWLQCLAGTFPIAHAVVVGAGKCSSPWLRFLRESTNNTVTLFEADANACRHLKRAYGQRSNWIVRNELIAAQAGPATFHRVSLSSENGLVDPHELQNLWPGLGARDSVPLHAVALEDVLETLPSPADWLVIDCFPSLSLLESCHLQHSAIRVILTRVIHAPDQLHSAASSMAGMVSSLDSSGFRLIASEPGINPKTGYALFVRKAANLSASNPDQARTAAEALSVSVKKVRSKAHAIRSTLLPDTPQSNAIELLCTEINILDHELSLSIERGQLQVQTPADGPPPASISELNRRWLERIRALAVSQLGQDLWVLERTSYKRGGFFVEFGATNGILLSNSYLLESEFGWSGICAEPNPHFFSQLRENRLCTLSPECIGPVTGEEVDFVFADVFGGMLRDIDKDEHKAAREAYRDSGSTARLTTISLHDFLKKHGAPQTIDYLSIDTEGSEFAILETFPFEQWDIRHITVEHNQTPQRMQIRELLEAHGYACQEAKWDDWYYKTSTLP